MKISPNNVRRMPSGEISKKKSMLPKTFECEVCCGAETLYQSHNDIKNFRPLHKLFLARNLCNQTISKTE